MNARLARALAGAARPLPEPREEDARVVTEIHGAFTAEQWALVVAVARGEQLTSVASDREIRAAAKLRAILLRRDGRIA